jgi:hypothetical protein
MKGTENFKKTIENFITSASEKNDLLKLALAKEEKTIDGCINFILNEVHKSGINGWADEDVYELAVFYYIQDNIEESKPLEMDIVVNHRVELTAEEKEEQKEKAKNEIFNQTLADLKKKKPTIGKQDPTTLTLF